MGFVTDTLALLLVPGTALALVAGLVTIFLLTHIPARLNRVTTEPLRVSALEAVEGLPAELRQAWHGDALTLSLLVAGATSVGAASVLITRAAWSGPSAESDAVVLLGLMLSVPTLLFVARYRGAPPDAEGADGLTLAYLSVWTLGLLVGPVKAGSLHLTQVSAGQVATGPLLLTTMGFMGAIGSFLALAGTALLLAPWAARAGSPLWAVVFGAWLYAALGATALLFLSGPVSGIGGLALFLLKWLLLLALLMVLSEAARRVGRARVIAWAWLPAALLVLAALALAVVGL